MRRLEWQAHERGSSVTPGSEASTYNWWRYTDSLVERVAQRAARTPAELRAMGREPFKRLIGHILWKEEYDRRLELCRRSVRLDVAVAEMRQLAAEDARHNRQRMHWPGAPYLPYVDSKYHVRLLAMARLGLLPIEMEEGRWHGICREERLCALGCGVVGDMHHFLNSCAALATDGVGALDRHSTESENTGSPLFFWRAKARKLERRWRERTCAVKGSRAAPENPADAHDDAVQADVDAELKIAIGEFRSFRSSAQPGSRAKKTNVKKPRKSKVVASDGGAHSKKSKKPRKERRKAGPTEDS